MAFKIPSIKFNLARTVGGKTCAPVSFKNQTWESFKKGISKTVSDYLK